MFIQKSALFVLAEMFIQHAFVAEIFFVTIDYCLKFKNELKGLS